MNIFLRIINLFQEKERKRLYLLAVLLLTTGLMEVFGLGLIFPFIGLATNQDFLTNQPVLHNLFSHLKDWGIDQDPVVLLGSGLLVLFVVKYIMVILLTRKQYEIIYGNQVLIGQRLLSEYLSKDYVFFTNTSSSVLIRNLTVDTSQVANGVLIASLVLFSEGILLVGLLSVLLVINYQVVLIAFGVVAIVLYGTSLLVRPMLIRDGTTNRNLISKMIEIINHSIGAIKDIKVLSLESYFINDFKEVGKKYVTASSRIQVFTQVPRLTIEVMIVGFVVAGVLLLRLDGVGLMDRLPTIAVFGTVLVRMMPSLNRMMSSLNGVKQHEAALENIIHELQVAQQGAQVQVQEKLAFESTIQLKDISFRHSSASEYLFRNFSFTVKKGEMIGIVGSSGSGKSTLVELLLGLLKPATGTYQIDGNVVEPMPGMYGLMGYVQQSVFLVNDTIEENILLGRTASMQVFERSIHDSELDDFVQSLPGKNKTVVGERGALISGGQKQRIGIARALVGDPAVLILDESTSALDYETEDRLIESITAHQGERTIIMIAHRLDSLRNCTRLVRLEGGKITFEGTYPELLASAH